MVELIFVVLLCFVTGNLGKPFSKAIYIIAVWALVVTALVVAIAKPEPMISAAISLFVVKLIVGGLAGGAAYGIGRVSRSKGFVLPQRIGE